MGTAAVFPDSLDRFTAGRVCQALPALSHGVSGCREEHRGLSLQKEGLRHCRWR